MEPWDCRCERPLSFRAPTGKQVLGSCASNDAEMSENARWLLIGSSRDNARGPVARVGAVRPPERSGTPGGISKSCVPAHLTNYTYDKNGNLIQENACISISGKGSGVSCTLAWEISYSYDSTGQLTGPFFDGWEAVLIEAGREERFIFRQAGAEAKEVVWPAGTFRSVVQRAIDEFKRLAPALLPH
jgi:hypothetical protein